ncbi:phage Terminase small Subunit, partial [gut metagenome]
NKTNRNEKDRERVIEELCCIAFSRATDYVEVRDGKLTVKDTRSLTDAAARGLVGIREGTRGVEIKLGDKLRALELLGRCYGAFDREAGPEPERLPQILDDIED